MMGMVMMIVGKFFRIVGGFGLFVVCVKDLSFASHSPCGVVMS